MKNYTYSREKFTEAVKKIRLDVRDGLILENCLLNLSSYELTPFILSDTLSYIESLVSDRVDSKVYNDEVDRLERENLSLRQELASTRATLDFLVDKIEKTAKTLKEKIHSSQNG